MDASEPREPGEIAIDAGHLVPHVTLACATSLPRGNSRIQQVNPGRILQRKMARPGTSTALSRAIVRMGRRRFALFISGLLAAAGLAGHVIRGRAATPLDRFLALSTLLTGVDDLVRDHAQIYLDCLLARPEQAAALEDLYARAGLVGDAPACTLDDLTGRGVFDDGRLRALADEILLFWYTGEYDAADGRALATYEGSLAWRSLPYASAPGTCGGAMGFWGEPPAG